MTAMNDVTETLLRRTENGPAIGRRDSQSDTAAAGRRLWPTNGALLLLCAALFLLPNMIFALTLGNPAGAVILIAGAICAAVAWRGDAATEPRLLSAPIDLRAFALSACLALALCLLGGEGHFFYAPPDWLVRDAVLSDLVGRGYPVAYRYDGHDYLLRAPLGLYMTPMVVGRMFSLAAAHEALLAQNALILSIILYFVAQLANARRLPVVLLFVAFSGLDIVPVIGAEAMHLWRSGELFPFSHIEWWNKQVQYSSHVTQLFWVPNHMLPGWWFATLTLLHVRREVGLSLLLASFATLLFWSPLSVLGAVPFLALFGLEQLPRRVFARGNLIAAAGALLFLPVALYLTIDAGEVPHRFLFEIEGFAALYLMFLVIEIPHAGIVAVAWRKIDACDRRIVALAVAALVAIPLYMFGPSNDFAMRASIPALFLLAFAFARIAALTPRDNERLATAISVVALLGFATPMVEFRMAFTPPYAISDCNLLSAWKKADPTVWPANYLARIEKVPAWIAKAGEERLAIESRVCWPDHPLLDAARK